FNFDGRAEILVGPGFGAPPYLRIFRGDLPIPSGDAAGPQRLFQFLAYQAEAAFETPFPNAPLVQPGVSSVAFGGNNGNGSLDVLVATGVGIRTRIFQLSAPFSTPATVPLFDVG